MCVLLQCRADDKPFTETTQELEYGVLQFVDVTGIERGQYICTATNNAGTSTATIELNIPGTQQINSALHPSGIAKLNTNLGRDKGGEVTAAGWH